MPEAVIVATARSPIGRAFKGSMTAVRPDDLVIQMVQAALDEFDVAYRDAPPSVDRDFIRELIPFLGERDI